MHFKGWKNFVGDIIPKGSGECVRMEKVLIKKHIFFKE